MHTGTAKHDWTLSSFFVTFISGQSMYNNNTSCITLFIINDTKLGNTESFLLMFTVTSRIRYMAARSEVNITINEDPNDGTLQLVANHALVIISFVPYFRC